MKKKTCGGRGRSRRRWWPAMRDRGDGAPGGEQGRKKEARCDQGARGRGGAGACTGWTRDGRGATAGEETAKCWGRNGPSRAIYKKGFRTGCYWQLVQKEPFNTGCYWQSVLKVFFRPLKFPRAKQPFCAGC